MMRFFFFLILLILSRPVFSQNIKWLETSSKEFEKLYHLFSNATLTGEEQNDTYTGFEQFTLDTLSIGFWKGYMEDIPRQQFEIEITETYPYIRGIYRNFSLWTEGTDTTTGNLVGVNKRGHIIMVLQYAHHKPGVKDIFCNMEGICMSFKAPSKQMHNFLGKKQDHGLNGASTGFFTLIKQD